MNLQEIIALLITLTAAASYINYRYVRLPSAVGITLITLLFSLALMGIDRIVGFNSLAIGAHVLERINFNATFMGGMISFLLFAGALHVNAIELLEHKFVVFVLATFSVVVSTFIIGIALWFIARLFNFQISLIYPLLFGALIAPTDPIAVLGILKKVRANKELEMWISGESLFNDGISIVLFVILLEIATGHQALEKHTIVIFFFKQLIGGIIVGAILGAFTNFLLKKVNDFEVSILITLALVTGGYLLGVYLGVSGPISMVVAGLIIGAKLNRGGLSAQTTQHLQAFWDIIDEVLNAVLFVLIGLVVFQLKFITFGTSLLALLAVPITLIARLISVALPIGLLSFFRPLGKNAITILTWGGIRGGISIALVLSLPNVGLKDAILTATYAVVVFSIIVQGLTIGKLIRYSLKKA